MNDVIPDGWSNPKLDDIVTKFQNGYAFSAKGYVPEGIPIISMGSIQLDGTFKKNNTKLKYWDAAAKEDLSRYLVKSEDLIMAMTDVTPTMELIGRACIVKGNGEYFLNQRVGLISVDEEKSSKPFLSYLTNFNQWRSYCIGSSGLGAQANLGTSQILDGSILLPPLPEQQKIAAILSSVDEVIEKTQAQIEKLKDLKTGMMQELLSPREPKAGDQTVTQASKTNGLHYTEFKDSPLGRIPVGWEVVSVGSVADVIDPQPDHRTPPEVEGGIPYIGLGDINKSGLINFSSARKVSLDAFNKQLNSFVIHPKAFIFGKIGTIGNPSILPERRFYCLSANIILITTSNLETMEYLYQVFTSGVINQQVAMQTNTTSQPALGIKKVRDFLIPIPNDINEQKIIVNTLSSIDKKTVLINEKLMSLNDTKKALMQDLLTGKIRVQVDAS